MENKIQYLNNGKIAQSSSIHSTRVSNANMKIKNGKLFTRELTAALQEQNSKKSNYNSIEGNNFSNWLMNTLNPLNHIPIVSTIKKLANETDKSLDIAQSAIGGAIYGGPLGIAKGIGGWFLNKIIPEKKVASNSEKLEDTQLNKNISNKKFKKNISNSSNSIVSPNKSLNDSEKKFDILNDISVKQTKQFNNPSLYGPSEEPKQKSNIIDTDA